MNSVERLKTSALPLFPRKYGVTSVFMALTLAKPTSDAEMKESEKTTSAERRCCQVTWSSMLPFWGVVISSPRVASAGKGRNSLSPEAYVQRSNWTAVTAPLLLWPLSCPPYLPWGGDLKNPGERWISASFRESPAGHTCWPLQGEGGALSHLWTLWLLFQERSRGRFSVALVYPAVQLPLEEAGSHSNTTALTQDNQWLTEEF